MPRSLSIFLFASALFVGMIFFLELGRRVGRRSFSKESDRSGITVIEGAIYALLGLLIAFTFSGAASRFDTRRHLIVEEAGAMHTAYLRLDLLSAQDQPEAKRLLKEYSGARLGVYQKFHDKTASQQSQAQADELEGRIWTQAVAGCHGQDQACAKLLLPALNTLFEISLERMTTARWHPPRIVFQMLFGLGLACAFLAGMAMGGTKTSKLYSIGFALVTALTLYVILDIEYPRTGLIRLDEADRVLEEILQRMK